MRDHRLVRLRMELFVDDIDASIAFYTEMLGFRISRHTGDSLSRVARIEPLQLRPWGLHDFRLIDPDGYYLRVTHRNTETS